MRIAIPVFGDRVSPRFDCAASFLLVDAAKGLITDRRELEMAAWTTRERIRQLVALGVEVVLCGGIDRSAAESLDAIGIRLVAGLTGSIEDRLRGFLDRELEGGEMSRGFSPSLGGPSGTGGGIE